MPLVFQYKIIYFETLVYPVNMYDSPVMDDL